MPRTAYCKVCQRNMVPGDDGRCPVCGKHLKRSGLHLSWSVRTRPVLDWIAWNRPLRIFLPLYLLSVFSVCFFEILRGGLPSLDPLMEAGFLRTSLLILLFSLSFLGLLLLLRGEHMVHCEIGKDGITVLTDLVRPSPLKLLCHFRDPSILRAERAMQSLRVQEERLSWEDVCRVQVWPEKSLLLFYATPHFLTLALPCTPFEWEDVLGETAEALKKRDDVRLPKELLDAEVPDGRIHALFSRMLSLFRSGKKRKPARRTRATGKAKTKAKTGQGRGGKGKSTKKTASAPKKQTRKRPASGSVTSDTFLEEIRKMNAEDERLNPPDPIR